MEVSFFNVDELGRSLELLGLSTDAQLFESLSAAYGEPHRFYHTDKHVSECLAHFKATDAKVKFSGEVEIAFWFHDAIYDTHRNDNEALSANWARSYLESRDVASVVVNRIEKLILATQSHIANTEDTALMLDIDLGILGASEVAFESYDQAIREEFKWVPEEAYKKARVGVLRSFLDRAKIYQTEYFRKRYEDSARDNLSRKVQELQIL